MSIDKLNEFIEVNGDKKVKSIRDELMLIVSELMSSKGKESVVRRDENGEVVEIFCYFHKVWEDVKVIEYGNKKGSSTGLNTMCKEGVRCWTRLQKLIKEVDEALIDELYKGSLSVADLKVEKFKRIEALKEESKNW